MKIPSAIYAINNLALRLASNIVGSHGNFQHFQCYKYCMHNTGNNSLIDIFIIIETYID